MRILKLHFKNLNSLVGDWTIDFTLPEYSEQGIFAITGPTGAGKSTILDAICLALYGRTPRLERINASQNEIMSRQCGECFASLEFQTSSGRYRTWWKQTRAHKKPDGNLQNAQHVIEDRGNKKTLEDKLSKTPLVVTEVTGMDFEHFTRAMLLAQGGFAKFLQSNADERSPILEKITGTEIYSQISKLVHERKISEEAKLDNINAKLSGINLLNSTEIELLNAELTELNSKIKELANNKIELQKQQAWLNDLQKLYDELDSIHQAQQQLQLSQEQFAIEELRLKDAKVAQEINTDIYINLLALRKQVRDIKQNLSDNEQELPQVQEGVAKQQIDFTQVNNEFISYKTTYASNLKTLQEVRLLDADILTKASIIAGVNTKLDGCNTEINKLVLLQQGFISQQNQKQLLQTEISSYLEAHQADALLVTSYSGICAGLDSLSDLNARITSYQAEQTNELSNQSKLTEKLQEVQQNEAKHKIDNEELNVQIAQLQQSIQQLSTGKSVAVLADEILHLNNTRSDYSELAKDLQETAGLDLKLNKTQHELNQQNKFLEESSVALAKESELLESSNQLMDSLNSQKILQSKIVSLSEERNNLEPLKPCPLCGSLDHPYANNLPVDNELDSQIDKIKSRISELQKSITKLNNQFATNGAKIENLTEQQNEVASRKDLLQQSISNLLSKYSLNTDEVNTTIIQQTLTKFDEQTTKLKDQIKQLHGYETQLDEYKAKQQSLLKILSDTNLDLTKFTEQKLALEKRLNELDRDLIATQDEYKILLTKLTNELSNYQIHSIKSTEILPIKETLASRLNTWQTKQQQSDSVKQELQELAHQIEQSNSLQLNINKQIAEHTNELSLQQKGLNEVSSKRKELFGDKNTEETEKQWVNELRIIEERANAAKIKLDKLTQQQTTLLAVIDKDKTQLQPLQDKQGQLEQQFTARLNNVNIANEEEFIAKRLSREEIDAIQNRSNELKLQAIELSNRQKRTTDTLSGEQQKQYTSKTIDELQIEIDSIQNNSDAYNQSMGEISAQLTANQQAQEQQKDSLVLRDKQLDITKQYRDLHVLIGSSDGKKFRNFAQGLTFELVVKHANQQLLQMSDRYLLTRDNNAPLELNVIDNYQGGEVRTTKNLSGGESFVISLALALGLSKLSSNKVQVDSLFLDEGFGTLDEDSLQTALDALDSLQRDGKLIGVISHVGALKERISLQIQVEPVNGGVSRISGIGCSGK